VATQTRGSARGARQAFYTRLSLRPKKDYRGTRKNGGGGTRALSPLPEFFWAHPARG